MKSVIALAGLTVWLVGAQAVMAAPAPASNPEMKRIYDADQADRSGDIDKIDWPAVGPRDAKRRARTRQLLADGGLHSGADFMEAAYVFQHGDTADDCLMAHTLAMIAVRKGDRQGPYIAAASLDRYLQRIGRPQIYGTQNTSVNGGPRTKEPYDRGLISDALRRELAVPDLATQDRELARVNAGIVPAPAPRPTPDAQPAKCDAGPVDRVFLKATWHVYACDDGSLLAMSSGEPPELVPVFVFAGKVNAVLADGGHDDAEAEAARAAFQAMTPDQIAELAARIRASRQAP